MNKEYIKKIHNWIEDNLEIYNAYTFKTEKGKPKDFTITDNGVINYLNKKYGLLKSGKQFDLSTTVVKKILKKYKISIRDYNTSKE